MQIETNRKKLHKFDVVADLILHTDITNNLFDASWRRGNIGLVQFSSAIGKIYNASKHDDPYADWYLMKTYNAIKISREKIKNINEALTIIIKNHQEMKLRYLTNKPWQKSLRIYSPFSHLAALLLTEVDEVIRLIIILQHVKSIHGQSDASFREPIEILQKTFAVPFAWKKTGVTRTDIRENNQKALEAQKCFTEPLPNAVLNREIEFSFLPKLSEK
jgi:integrating conjugative element protein (TIGR03761 family)